MSALDQSFLSQRKVAEQVAASAQLQTPLLVPKGRGLLLRVENYSTSVLLVLVARFLPVGAQQVEEVSVQFEPTAQVVPGSSIAGMENRFVRLDLSRDVYLLNVSLYRTRPSFLTFNTDKGCWAELFLGFGVNVEAPTNAQLTAFVPQARLLSDWIRDFNVLSWPGVAVSSGFEDGRIFGPFWLQNAASGNGEGTVLPLSRLPNGLLALEITTAGGFLGTVEFASELATGAPGIPVRGTRTSDGTIASSVTNPANGELWQFDVAGFLQFRARTSGVTAGDVTVKVTVRKG